MTPMPASGLDMLTEAIERADPEEALRLYQALSTLATMALVRSLEPTAPRAKPRRKERILRLVEPRAPRARPKRRAGGSGPVS